VVQSISIGMNSIVAAGSTAYKDLVNDIILIQKNKIFANKKEGC
jgi:hypothetical protein